ncbi:MAG TPA: orotate phosphoribosyltransferase, partial [Methanothrix sp.]|nr:orotate phosphoribosyltransferase [Methanothrix sp.]
MEERARLLELLRTRALRVRRITLSSGKTSDYYVDAREVVLHPEGAYLTGRLLLELIDPEAVAVA